MNLLALVLKNNNWKTLNVVWELIEPFILNLVKKSVPKSITKLYENIAKTTQPLVLSLFALKNKVKTSPNQLDNYCFEQGVNALNTFANYLQGVVDELRKD